VLLQKIDTARMVGIDLVEGGYQRPGITDEHYGR
jgi:hypothetical protein